MICVLRPVRVIGIYASLGRGDGRGDCAGGRLRLRTPLAGSITAAAMCVEGFQAICAGR